LLMKVLIVTKDLDCKGGVGVFFNALNKKFTMPVTFFIAGSRAREVNFFTGVIRFFYDYIKFISIISTYSLVHINSSMRPKAIMRDAVFLLFAKAARKKTIVFVHGWDIDVIKVIEKYFLWLYKAVFFRTDAFIVLSRDFTSILRTWGYKRPVYMLSGLVDEAMLKGIDEKALSEKIQEQRPIRILFLARLEKEKGIYQTIRIFEILKKRHKDIQLVIAGDGHEYQNAVKLVSSQRLADVQFLGFVRDEKKRQTFMNADIYLFPTFYGEGMPLSIFEAMAFGLPVITRPMGGIKDFFIDGQMGCLVNGLHPEEFVPCIDKLIRNKPRRIKIALNNYHYIQENHLSVIILKNLENVYRDFVN
jgi:glycosyltransferase involved in cell wall biosynthesis